MENKELTTNENKERLVNYLKRSIGSNLKQEDIEYFLEYAINCNLNPFKREIYAIPYKVKDNGVERDTIQILTGYEVYIKRGEATGLIEYWEFGSAKDKEGQLYGWCEVKRVDRSKPLRVTLYAREYTTGKSTWLTKANTMIEKCAISSAFRKSFPLEVGELPYTIEEFWKNQKESNEILEAKEEIKQIDAHRKENNEQANIANVKEALNAIHNK